MISDLLLALIPAAFIAGFITSIAGGGGILFVTTAIALGVPSLNALALNRVTDLGVLTGAFNNFRKVPEIPWRSIKIFTPLFLIGAIAGASFSVSIDEATLQTLLIGAAVLAIGLTIIRPRPQVSGERKWFLIGYFFIFIIGFWDGAIAMAGTTFFMIAAHYFFGMDYMKARVVNMFTAIPETIISAAILITHSTISLSTGLTLYVCAAIGAYVGSKIAITKGQEFIRYGMIAVSVMMIAKLVIYDMILKS
ncbi:MAG: hypothetical protein COB76_06770 [Alphaproteobacteria bacterium]|nr:MAG: hypothetical protein COB76_06770 [Alphaproteobacteria bacterium]